MHIIFIQTNPTNELWNSLKTRFPTAKKAKTFDDARKVSLTDFFWIVWDDLVVANNFEFDYGFIYDATISTVISPIDYGSV